MPGGGGKSREGRLNEGGNKAAKGREEANHGEMKKKKKSRAINAGCNYLAKYKREHLPFFVFTIKNNGALPSRNLNAGMNGHLRLASSTAVER